MAGKKAPWWKWFPTDYIAAVTTLDLRLQGAWMRVISHGQMNGTRPGVMEGNLAWLAADFRVEKNEVWDMLMNLALIRIGELRVDRGQGFEEVTEAWAQEHSAEKPDLFWRVEMTCRRTVRDAESRQKKLENYYDQKPDDCQNGASCNTTTDRMTHPVSEGVKKEGILLAREEAEAEAEAEPPKPPSPSRRPGRRRQVGRVEENTELMVRIGRWFGRRETTRWTTEEAGKLKRIKPQADELDILERYYQSEHREIKPYLRTNVETLLNNWMSDVDKARRKLERYETPEEPGGGRECRMFDGKVE